MEFSRQSSRSRSNQVSQFDLIAGAVFESIELYTREMRKASQELSQSAALTKSLTSSLHEWSMEAMRELQAYKELEVENKALYGESRSVQSDIHKLRARILAAQRLCDIRNGTIQSQTNELKELGDIHCMEAAASSFLSEISQQSGAEGQNDAYVNLEHVADLPNLLLSLSNSGHHAHLSSMNSKLHDVLEVVESTQ